MKFDTTDLERGIRDLEEQFQENDIEIMHSDLLEFCLNYREAYHQVQTMEEHRFIITKKAYGKSYRTEALQKDTVLQYFKGDIECNFIERGSHGRQKI